MCGSESWWWDAGTGGLTGYLGNAPCDGLQWRRHGYECRPGFWSVAITGWDAYGHKAVIDDFGNLVRVP